MPMGRSTDGFFTWSAQEHCHDLCADWLMRIYVSGRHRCTAVGPADEAAAAAAGDTAPHTSSAVVAMTSKPMNEKKTTDAAEKMPCTPKGAKGSKLEPAAYGMPAHTTNTTTARLIMVMMVLKRADSCTMCAVRVLPRESPPKKQARSNGR